MQVSVSDSAYGHPYSTVGPTVVAALICMSQTWPTYNVMCNAIRDTCVLSLREKLLNRERPFVYDPVGGEKQNEKHTCRQSHVQI